MVSYGCTAESQQQPTYRGWVMHSGERESWTDGDEEEVVPKNFLIRRPFRLDNNCHQEKFYMKLISSEDCCRSLSGVT